VIENEVGTLASILGTAGGSSSLSAAVVYWIMKRNGNGESRGSLDAKVDKMIELQHQTNLLLAEIKGALNHD
jgi:hypothetical protein